MQAYIYVIVGIILALLYSFVNMYNDFKRYKNAADATLGQIRVSMKKRFDLIEQLLGAVKGYVKHERELFESIAKLRAGVDSKAVDSLGGLETESRTITGSLLAVAEAYPDLRLLREFRTLWKLWSRLRTRSLVIDTRTIISCKSTIQCRTLFHRACLQDTRTHPRRDI